MISRVVRHGHIRRVTRHEIVLDDGRIPLPADALVVHCAASGLAHPPMVPVWGPDTIRLQPSGPASPASAPRSPATSKPPATTTGNATWARMQVRGTLATRQHSREADIASWVDRCALNPARIDDAQRVTPAVAAAAARLAAHVDTGLDRLSPWRMNRRPPATHLSHHPTIAGDDGSRTASPAAVAPRRLRGRRSAGAQGPRTSSLTEATGPSGRPLSEANCAVPRTVRPCPHAALSPRCISRGAASGRRSACSRFDRCGPQSQSASGPRRASTGSLPRRSASMYARSAASRAATSAPSATAPWPGITTSTCAAAAPSSSSAAS